VDAVRTACSVDSRPLRAGSHLRAVDVIPAQRDEPLIRWQPAAQFVGLLGEFGGADGMPRRRPPDSANAPAARHSTWFHLSVRHARRGLDRCVNAVVPVWLRTARECVICAAFQVRVHW